MERKSQKFLIIKQSSLGDIVHSLPVLSAIKEMNPENFTGFVVGDKFAQIVKNHPLIDELYIIPRQQMKQDKFKIKTFFKYLQVIHQIRKQKYDIALDLQGILKSGIILGFSGAKRRITKKLAREMSYIFANEKIPAEYYKKEHTQSVLNHLRTLEYATGFSSSKIECVLPKASDFVRQKIKKNISTLDKEKKTICLAVATTWPNKHWREEYWAEVIDYLYLKYNIIFTGGKNDNSLVERILDKTENFANGINREKILNLCGKTTIDELVEVFRHCDVVVSPDSGSAHVAWGTGKPVVIVIFCATPSFLYRPYGERHFAFPEKSNCLTCHKRDCPKTEDRYACCSFVKPHEIIEAIEKSVKAEIS